MKITEELKILMQVNSFIGMVAAAALVHMGLHTNMAWCGLIANGYCLIYWVFVKTEDETDKK